MTIQSQDLEKQRHKTQNASSPNQTPVPPQDRPPGQPHDPPAEPGQGGKVVRPREPPLTAHRSVSAKVIEETERSP